MVMEYVSGGELFDYILNHGKVSTLFYNYFSLCFEDSIPTWSQPLLTIWGIFELPLYNGDGFNGSFGG